MPSQSDRTPPAAAAALGAVTGLRSTAGPAALGLRGRWGRSGRIAALLAATGEVTFDKLPAVPPRSDLPSLTGRILSGAFTGREVGGASGAGAGAACALATAYGSQRLRALVGERTGLPDALIGALEDAVVIVVAAGATRAAPRPAAEAEAGARHEPEDPPDQPQPERRPSLLGSAGRGLAAAAIGTAAMTSAQNAYLRLTGGAPSLVPEQMGRRIIEGGLGRRVPRKRRGALNQGIHMLYGTAWGLPFSLVVGSLRNRPRASAAGAALGLTAWGASMVELPALGLSPPPWQQPPGALVVDLAMHLVYGASTAAVYQVLA